MTRYIVHRMAAIALLTWGAVTLIFALLRLVPGDVVQILLGEGGMASPELVASTRHSLGLDRPLLVQYGDWIAGLVHLNLGVSLATQRPIATDIWNALPRTIELIAAALAFGVCVGIPAGLLGAVRRGWLREAVVTSISLGGLAVPTFVSGTLMVLCFGLLLRWFPTAGYVSPAENFFVHLRYLVLPAVALGLSVAAITARYTHTAVLQVLGEDFVRTAYAKGLHSRGVMYHHVLKNALIPVITVLGVQGGYLLGGTIVVEYVFNWPGMSSLLIQGATRRDYPMVQGVVLVIAVLFLVLNLIVDLLNAYVDPRIRYS